MTRWTNSDREFRSEVSRKILQKLGKLRISQAEAARQLGITRQALNQIVHGAATPRAEVLTRACQLWDLVLDYRGTQFSKDAFRTKPARPQSSPLQLSLFEPQFLQNERISLRVQPKKSHNTLDLQLTIRLAG